MNWLKFALQILQLAPIVVMGVEKIAGETNSATKQQMAHDSLILASGVAAGIDPKDTETIQAVSDATKSVIDNTVTAFNAAGVFKKTPASVAIAPTA